MFKKLFNYLTSDWTPLLMAYTMVLSIVVTVVSYDIFKTLTEKHDCRPVIPPSNITYSNGRIKIFTISSSIAKNALTNSSISVVYKNENVLFKSEENLYKIDIVSPKLGTGHDIIYKQINKTICRLVGTSCENLDIWKADIKINHNGCPITFNLPSEVLGQKEKGE